jgi:hypothetical protein
MSTQTQPLARPRIAAQSARRLASFPVVRPVAELPKRAITDAQLKVMRVDKLREALRDNRVSFPSQVPTFERHTRPDLQRKVVQLYFVLGWNSMQIRARYKLGRQRLQQILITWKKRAVELGYIQPIPPVDRNFPSGRLPVRVVMSPVHDAAVPLLCEISPAASAAAPLGGAHPAESGKGCRPRCKCDTKQIGDIIEKLQNGRTAEEIADEVGVVVATVRSWKRTHELRSLRNENAELKKRLAQFAAIEKTDSSHRNYHS